MPSNKSVYNKKGEIKKMKLKLTGKTLRELSEDKIFTIKDFKNRYSI